MTAIPSTAYGEEAYGDDRYGGNVPRGSYPALGDIRLEVEQPHVGMRNLILNPDGALGGWGWRGDLAAGGAETLIDTADGVTPPALLIRAVAAGVDAVAGSSAFAVTPGKYVHVLLDLEAYALPTLTLAFKFYNSAGAFISEHAVTDSVTAGSFYIISAPVPASSSTAQFVIKTTHDAGVAEATVRATVVQTDTLAPPPAFTFIDTTPVYADVLGSAISAHIVREDLNVAELTATIKDVTLDPATTDLIRPGRRMRLTAQTNAGVWEVIFTGRIDNSPVAYDLAETDEGKRATITVHAVDDIALLANTPAPDGYGTLQGFTSVLEEVSVVPWNIDGNTGHVAAQAPIVTNPDAKALDQLVIQRDTVHGFAWMGRRGEVNLVTAANLPALAGTLAEADYNTAGPRVTWDVDEVINDITLTVNLRNAITGETTSVTWGPYQDLESVRMWGVRHRDFTVQGIANDEATMRAWAQAVFATNAQPAVRVKSVTVPIRTRSDLTPAKALVELYNLVRVTNADAAVDQSNRVTRIEHHIAPGSWTVEQGFSVNGGSPAGGTPSTTPAVAAALPSATVGVTTPEKPHREVEATANLALANGTVTTVTGWADVHDVGDIEHAAGVFTVPRAGRYLVTAWAGFASNAAGVRGLFIRQNGTTRWQTYIHPAAASSLAPAISGLLTCEAGDTVDLAAQQTSGAALNLTTRRLVITYLD